MKKLSTLFLALFLFLLFSNAQTTISLTDGLVAYYPFKGNARDSSGKANHPIFNNAQLTQDRFGNNNEAYKFNGIDSYIQIPNSTSLQLGNSISICTWIKVDGFYKGTCQSNRPIMKGLDGTFGNYSIVIQPINSTCSGGVVDTLNEHFYSIFGGNPSVKPIGKNIWYFVVFTSDGTNARVYVNNKLSFTASANNTSFSNSYDLFFGKMNNSQYPFWFNGVLDDIRIYNRAINENEIKELYGTGNCGDNSSFYSLSMSPNNKLTKAYFMENVSMGSDASQIELLATSWTSGGYYNGRSLITYDISKIPQNAIVNKANFYLYAKLSALNGLKGQPTYGSSNSGLLQKVISSWNGSTVNLNNLPNVADNPVIIPQSTTTAQDYTLDITDFVQSWVANPASNYGMMLRMQKENNPYNSLIFESGAATDSTKRPRLEICYTVPNILPATLVSFDVQYQVGQFADIQFATANELNLATIQVEKSVGGSAFTTLTTLNAKGGTLQQYNVQDATPTANTYYRLRLVNTDGSFVYSSVAKLAISAQEKLVRLQPNPLVGAQPLVVTITNSKEEVAAYRLYNFAGKRIAEKTIYLQKGVNTIKIAEIANLVPGTYHLQVVSANQTINKKVVKMD